MGLGATGQVEEAVVNVVGGCSAANDDQGPLDVLKGCPRHRLVRSSDPAQAKREGQRQGDDKPR